MKYNNFYLKKNKLFLNSYIFILSLKYMNLKILKNNKKLLNTSLLLNIKKNISIIKTILNKKLINENFNRKNYKYK